jgi:hypothetical protein
MEFVDFDKLSIPKDYLSNFVESNKNNININKNGILNITESIDNILINQLKCFLLEKGYVTKDYYSEIHYQNHKNYKNKFPWHIDSNGAIEGEVVTFIYYHHFTPNIKGGNLMIQDYKKYKWWFFEYKIYTEKTINVWSEGHKNRFVFMEENLEHKAEEIYFTENFERQFLTIFLQI